MPEPMAADSTSDTEAISPEPVGDQATAASNSGETLESAVAKTRPMRVRKLRTKATVSPKVNLDRPTLRLKASTAAHNVPGELVQSPGTAADTIEEEAFKLTGALEPALPAELPPGPQQIEIPELRTSLPSDLDGGHIEPSNGAAQDAAAMSPSIAILSEEASQTNGSLPIEPAGVSHDELSADNPSDELRIENTESQPQQEVSNPSQSLERQERINRASEPPAGDQEHGHSSPPDNDPRFTYVPQSDSRQFPIEERLDSGAKVPEPNPMETITDERFEARVENIAVPPRLLKFGLKTQLALLALVPILVGSVIAFLVASLSPTLFAARSEIVVNVASMDWSRAERFLATQLVVAKSRMTLEPISAATTIPLRDLEENVKVELIGASDVIAIQYANSDATLALEVVKAVTAQYLLSLRDYEQVGNGRHRLLMPATLLEEPVSLKPIYAALIGAIVGVAIGIAGMVLRTQAWRMK